MDHLTEWINVLLSELGESGSTINAIKKCGRNCAKKCGVMDDIEQNQVMIDSEADINTVIQKMNDLEIAGGILKYEDGYIHGKYAECYCPSGKLIEQKSFCRCTEGWLEEVFEKITRKPVDVFLDKTIRRGDSCCEFRIKIK